MSHPTDPNRAAGVASDAHVVVGSAPPRAPLAFRVGVVGHRPNRLAHADLEQLANVLSDILSIVKEEVLTMRQRAPMLFDNAEPLMRAISPLAEGTDRIFARQALDLDYELCCVMPFPQAEFERDFARGEALEDDSLASFHRLVSQAASRFELDGCRADEGGAYGAAGRTILHQSDLLVVVWDGQRQSKRGGTEETLDDARRLGVPVVWVDAHAPHRWQVLDAASSLAQIAADERHSPTDGDATQSLCDLVNAALELPKPRPSSSHGANHARSDDPRDGLQKFYAERQPRMTLAFVWKAFRDTVGDGKFPRIRFAVPPFEKDAEKEWPKEWTSPVGQIVDRMRPFFAWPDGLAVIYSNRYRSAFILVFLLAAFAVGMALLPFGAQMTLHHLPEIICIILELTAIIIILVFVYVGRRWRWRARWIDYRLTAEMVRHLRLVAPVGGGRPFPQIPAHWAVYGQPGSTWMAWYVRAVERALGLPTAVVTNDYLDTYLDRLSRRVEVQLGFHDVAAKRCNRIEKRLHGIGITLLILTLASCGLHLLDSWQHAHLPDWLRLPPAPEWLSGLPDWMPPLLTFFCGFFPALGAALAGILNQGEFRRIEMRSESMCEQLHVLGKEIEALRRQIREATAPEQFSIRAAALAGDAARLLLNEVLDWRVVFLDRPLVPPA